MTAETGNSMIRLGAAAAKLRLAWRAAACLGPQWAAYRLWYAAAHRGGVLERRMPCRRWDEVPLSGIVSATTAGPSAQSREQPIAEEPLPDQPTPEQYGQWKLGRLGPFFISTERRTARQPLLQQLDMAGQSLSCSAALVRGDWSLLIPGDRQREFPPNWHCPPGGDVSACSPALHWSRIDEFAAGDIKRLWEPARFGAAFSLVRAYWRSGDDVHADRYWRLAESFFRGNPPNRGPHWKCGQEAALRMLGWCFALHGLADSPATTPRRVAMTAQLVAATAERIEGNLGYGLSQQNNHGISEAAGLLTAGLMFPELDGSQRRTALGRKLLERQARQLIYDDGAFAQHSANYQRVMLQLMLWSIRLAELQGEPLSEGLCRRVGRCAEMLLHLHDPATGRVPNFGENDGALPLPLSGCRRRDFRGVIQAASAVLHGRPALPPGPWDEEAVWLAGERWRAEPPEAPAPRDFAAPEGGGYTLRTETSMAMVRCTARYRHRPGHVDPLHVDLWWRGQNIAADAGTFRYNAPAPWNHPLGAAAWHNTVTVDGREPMERIGRFLVSPWLQGAVATHDRSATGRMAVWEGGHDGYLRGLTPVFHRRAVVNLGRDTWLVLDRLHAAEEHDYRLHWLLIDAPCQWDQRRSRLELATLAGTFAVTLDCLGAEGGASLVRADENSPRGWKASDYGVREPAVSLSYRFRSRSVIAATLFASPDSRLSLSRGKAVVALAGEQSAVQIDLEAAPDRRLVQQLNWRNESSETWRPRPLSADQTKERT